MGLRDFDKVSLCHTHRGILILVRQRNNQGKGTGSKGGNIGLRLPSLLCWP